MEQIFQSTELPNQQNETTNHNVQPDFLNYTYGGSPEINSYSIEAPSQLGTFNVPAIAPGYQSSESHTQNLHHIEHSQIHHSGTSHDLLPIVGFSVLGAVAGIGGYEGTRYAWDKWLSPESQLKPGSIVESGGTYSDGSGPLTTGFDRFSGKGGMFTRMSIEDRKYSSISLDYVYDDRPYVSVSVNPERNGEIWISKLSDSRRVESARVAPDGELLYGDADMVRKTAQTMTAGLEGSEHMVSPTLAKALDVLKTVAD